MEETIYTPLSNLKNYYVYADAVAERKMIDVYVPKDVSIYNIDDHINAIEAILKDGIEDPYVQNLLVRVSWENDIWCDLFVVDYWFSLFMWSMVLRNGDPIRPKHIFWQPELRRKNIKQFVDSYVLTREQKITKGNVFLNKNCADGLWHFASIESFSYYLANTINNEDNIAMMKAIPEFNDIMHYSMVKNNIPFDQIKDVGLDMASTMIGYIKDSKKYLGYEHGLTNSFRANEAISPRQFKEVAQNIGTKSNGSGMAYPVIIDQSFMTGGVNRPDYYFTESSAARVAQILSKTNVGDSGDLARIMGLNNMDTILNPNMNYECGTRHFIKYEIKTKNHLSMIKNRYYRRNPRGIEYLIDDSDESMIGETIYLRSPITCACHSQGKGICKKCYGDLYYTNLNINAGKIAAEILSSVLTQRLLSAKHLLETLIVSIKWNPEFQDYFDIDTNTIKLADIGDDVNLKKSYMIIDPDDVTLVSDDEATITTVDEDGNEITVDNEYATYNEYITHFYIKLPDDTMITFGSEDMDSLYLSNELNRIIRRRANASDGQIMIPLSSLTDIVLFYIQINNNEISKSMYDIINIINKSAITEKLSKDEALQSMVDLVVNSGIDIDSVHLEVILSNQIVDSRNMLKKPNWNDPNAGYRMITLDHALTNNPSVVVSLLYKDLHRVMYNPLTFKKHAPSFFDLFFMVQPQNYMDSNMLTDKVDILDPIKGIEMVKIVNKKKKEETEVETE